MKREISSRDWFGKSSAGLILGFLLALGASGVFKSAAGLTDTYFTTKGQFGMWLMSPVWAFVVSFCFLFPSTRSAWGWLALTNGAVWGLLLVMGATA